MLYVSLTFDDALQCHLNHAAPILESYGFRGTFYINLNSSDFLQDIWEWRKIAKNGHELGNHTIFHPSILEKSYITEGNALENYTLDRMRLELEMASKLLTTLDNRKLRSFAYPCCNTIIGRKGLSKCLLKYFNLSRTRLMGVLLNYPVLDLFSKEQSYKLVVEKLFSAARIGGDYFCANKTFPPNDRYAVPSIIADGKNYNELEQTVLEYSQMKKGWLVFMFHGIGSGSGKLSISLPTFEKLIITLANNKNLTILPFSKVAEKIWH